MNRKKKIKRITALILALVYIISVTAYAAPEDEDQPSERPVQNEEAAEPPVDEEVPVVGDSEEPEEMSGGGESEAPKETSGGGESEAPKETSGGGESPTSPETSGVGESPTSTETPGVGENPTSTETPGAGESSATTETPTGGEGSAAGTSGQQIVSPTPEETLFLDETIVNEYSTVISTLEELRWIGQDAAYPLDGEYVLGDDINGEGAAFEAIGSAEEPFTGTLDGGGHTLSDITINGGGLFAGFQGKIRSMELRDITVNPAETAGVLAGTVSGEAEILDVFITGTILAADEAQAAGGMAGAVQSAAKIQKVQAYVTMSGAAEADRLMGAAETDRFLGALAGNNQAEAEVYSGCVWSDAYADLAFGVDSEVGEAAGAARIRTNPTYLALMAGGTDTLTANTNTEGYGLTFMGFETTDEAIVSIDQDGTATAGETTGTADIVSVYEHTFGDGSTEEVRFATPVIVSQNINEPLPLEPVDPIFPTQIEVMAPLEPLDGIFPTQIEQMQTVNDGTAIEITTWEQFKNIGNTEYDARFTLDADYVLAADITADAEPFTPIGSEEAPFAGTFDGRTYTIDVTKNKNIDETGAYHGLFAVVQPKE